MDRTLVYTILAIAVLLFVGMLVKDGLFGGKMNKTEAGPAAEGHKDGLTLTLPLCLQAYERLVVLLERCRPEVLLHRLQQPGLSVSGLRQLAVQTIQEEFAHNVSQQIYVSDAAWEAVTMAKEQLVHLLNGTAGKLEGNAPGTELQKALLNVHLRSDLAPIDIALKVVNSEAKKLLEAAKYA